MSIYTTLGTEVPLIQYGILHQPGKGVPEDEYRKTMLDLHRKVAEAFNVIQKAWTASSAEATDRAVDAMRGRLLQFLTTPLQSDTEEIRQLLVEQVRQAVDGAIPPTVPGFLGSTEGVVTTTSLKSGPMKRPAGSGRSYLEHLGFRTTRSAAPIFESTFVVEGGLQLDIIEHIVRYLVGIYGSTHGAHLRHFATSATAIHNVVYQKGPLAAPVGSSEALLYFAKGETKYAPFRKALADHLDRVWDVGGLMHISVWQRKLGLGPGHEFHVRIRTSGSEARMAATRKLLGGSGSEAVDNALRKGALVHREVLGGAVL